MPVDMKTVPKNDLGVIACAGLILLLSLVPGAVTASFEGAGLSESDSINMWHSYGWLGVLSAVVAGGLAAVRALGLVRLPTIAVGWSLITTACSAVGTLLIVLYVFTYNGGISESFGAIDGFSLSVGPGVVGIILIVLAVAETTFCVLGFRESGEATPWANRTSSGTATTSPGSHAAGTPVTGPTTTGAAPASSPPPPAAGPASSVPPASPAPPPSTTSTPPPAAPPPPA